MRIKYDKVSVGVEEVFFYDPKEWIINICTMCITKDCPVPDKDIVRNCNSYRHPPKVTDGEAIKEEFRIMAGMQVVSTPKLAYLANTAS